MHLVLRLRGGHCQGKCFVTSFIYFSCESVGYTDGVNCAIVPCGIFDDPAIVAEIKQAAETIRKSMVQSNDLHSGLTASNSAQELNQMVRTLVLTQKSLIKPVGFTHAHLC